MTLDPEIAAYYEKGGEAERLGEGVGRLELVRTQELLRRVLPAPPARLLDVGGAMGVHADWLVDEGYAVHLVDPMPLHVERATELAAGRFTASAGDARALEEADASFDAVLLLGPLYHLPERPERVGALAEAARVVRPGGTVVAAVISRFAPLLDNLRVGRLDDPTVAAMVERALRDGRHRNPDRTPGLFTTAYFHHPDEVPAELAAAGLEPLGLLGIEGPAWLLGDLDERLDDTARRQQVLEAARAVEAEPSLAGMSPHLLAVARRPG